MEHTNEEIIEGVFYIANKTEPLNFDTKNGCSKKEEWLKIQGSLYKVIKSNEKTTTLNGFASAENRFFTVSNEYLKKNFERIFPDSNGYLMPETYPVKIHISEFEKRKEVKELINLLKKF